MSVIRRVLRRLLPARWRRHLRVAVEEFPARFKDFLPDCRESLVPPRDTPPLPPPRLRRRVAGASSRARFLQIGRWALRDIRRAFEATRDPAAPYPRWLEFGCGCGRISRHIRGLEALREFWGVDVDREAIEWAARNLPGGRYLAIAREPPTVFPAESFDVVYAGSVFTHLDEAPALRWLAEISRLLRPGGLLIATTHSPSLTFTRPDLTADQHRQLQACGFLFAPGGASFNEDGSFHSRSYMESRWGEFFRPRLFEEHGYHGYQDLSVWEKRRPAPAPAG